jgi:hypothetical protein
LKSQTHHQLLFHAAAMAFGLRDVTPYLLLLMLISTLGPLQFGFHLVSFPLFGGILARFNC